MYLLSGLVHHNKTKYSLGMVLSIWMMFYSIMCSACYATLNIVREQTNNGGTADLVTLALLLINSAFYEK